MFHIKGKDKRLYEWRKLEKNKENNGDKDNVNRFGSCCVNYESGKGGAIYMKATVDNIRFFVNNVNFGNETGEISEDDKDYDKVNVVVNGRDIFIEATKKDTLFDIVDKDSLPALSDSSSSISLLMFLDWKELMVLMEIYIIFF